MLSDGSESPCGFPVPLTYSWPRDETAQQTPKGQARQAEPWQGHQLTSVPSPVPSLLGAAPGWVSLGCCWVTLTQPSLCHHTAQPVPSPLPALSSLAREGGNVLVLRLGRGRCAEGPVAVVTTGGTDWGHTPLMTDPGNDLFQGIETWAQVVGSLWQ